MEKALKQINLVPEYIIDNYKLSVALTLKVNEIVDFLNENYINKESELKVIQKNYWRDIKDELPKTRDDVLVCNKINKCVSVGWYNAEYNNGEGKWIVRTVHFDGEAVHFDGEVDLWMPLPELGSKEK